MYPLTMSSSGGHSMAARMVLYSIYDQSDKFNCKKVTETIYTSK